MFCFKSFLFITLLLNFILDKPFTSDAECFHVRDMNITWHIHTPNCSLSLNSNMLDINILNHALTSMKNKKTSAMTIIKKEKNREFFFITHK